MVSWILIAVLVLILFLFFKARDMRHKIFAIFVIILIIFLYLTSSKIIADNNINIKTFDGVMTAGKLYVKWVGYAINNVRGLTGNAVKMDWEGNVSK